MVPRSGTAFRILNRNSPVVLRSTTPFAVSRSKRRWLYHIVYYDPPFWSKVWDLTLDQIRDKIWINPFSLQVDPYFIPDRPIFYPGSIYELILKLYRRLSHAPTAGINLFVIYKLEVAICRGHVKEWFIDFIFKNFFLNHYIFYKYVLTIIICETLKNFCVN